MGGGNRRGRSVAVAVEVAEGGEIVDVPAGGDEAEVGFEAALEASERGVVGD